MAVGESPSATPTPQLTPVEAIEAALFFAISQGDRDEIRSILDTALLHPLHGTCEEALAVLEHIHEEDYDQQEEEDQQDVRTCVCCLACVDQGEEDQRAGVVACANGHCMHSECLEQFVRSRCERLRGVNSLTTEAAGASSTLELATLEGRVPCPCSLAGLRCSAPPLSDALIAKHVSESAFELYIEGRSLLQVAQREEAAFERARTLICTTHSDERTGAPNGISKGEDNEASADRRLLGGLLRSSMPSARQCGRCFFGPIEIKGCSDLVAHHGQVLARGGHAMLTRNRSRAHDDDLRANDGAVEPSSGSTSTLLSIDNRCPRCSWFAKSADEWPRWDGALPEDTLQMPMVEAVKAWQARAGADDDAMSLLQTLSDEAAVSEAAVEAAVRQAVARGVVDSERRDDALGAQLYPLVLALLQSGELVSYSPAPLVDSLDQRTSVESTHAHVHRGLAGKITGMLLELPDVEVVRMILSQTERTRMVLECIVVLEAEFGPLETAALEWAAS
jgi:hypothetical protein